MTEQRRVVEINPLAPVSITSLPLITSAISTVAVAIVTTVVLVATAARRYACIVNTGPTWVYLAFAEPAVVGRGIPLAPNGLGSYEITLLNPFVGAVNAIANGAASSVAVEEAT